MLAELDLDAEPETAEKEDGEEYRAHGQGFVGEDAETVAEILASVRENHVAQSAGRYARDPDDPQVTATVSVRTDAMPVAFADVQVPGVEWVFSDQQRKVVENIRGRERPATAKEVADETGVSKRHAQRTLKRLWEDSSVQRFEGEGTHGADLYVETGLPNSGMVSVDDEIGTEPSMGPNTWSVSISPPQASTLLVDEPEQEKQVENDTWWVDSHPDRVASGGGNDTT